MSEKNRFAPLAELPSSKEQEDQVPRSGTTARLLLDADEEGPPAEQTSRSMTGPEEPLPLSFEEKKALFKKRRAEYEKEERQKKWHESNISRLAAISTSSAAASQGLRKRTASSDEAEEPPKRRRTEPFPSGPTAGEPTAAASATSPKGNSSASEVVPYVDTALSPPSSFQWHDIRMPARPLPCVIQVKNSVHMGSFARNTKGWAFSLILKAGRWDVPTMTMKFFPEGIQGPQSAETGWCLGEWIKPDWMVTDFKVHRVADCAENGKICHSKVVGLCNNEEERARLVCISLEAWPKILGHFDRKNRWKNPQPGVKKLFSAMFTGRHPYHLRMWFIAPHDFERFEKQCLSIFTLFFQQRKPSYDGIRDANGVGFDF